ncbi:ribbon-helix-helix protein, CopG family [Thalassomonas sp. RHCl1]|uniref:ribbon-helix-helix protein, CopG family n=1 Tax=Thalassomonas sp. RHCl1 TaxID=2995320 RepID=UPI00248D1E89|nr:ribbon-helix-helix protein, CopG family [Thalassomonas sp. RHCl1]
MKKLAVLTVRVDSATDDAIQALAQADDRSVAWIARMLITEALEARKGAKPQNDKQQPGKS